MKKPISLILSILIALSPTACGTAAPAPTTIPAATEETKDYSQYAGIVADPKTWYEEFMALPIANDQMTEQELRQLCADAFKANLTFHWTPNAPISYTYTLSGKKSQVELLPGIAYSGLCYATGQSSGHLYKILNYYDLETGVLDIEAMNPSKVMSIVTSACARGAEQGWNRVSGTHGIGNMDSFNQYDANILPVGPYTYAQSDYNYDFGSRTATNEIIAKNGDDIMYESYAAMKTADGLYSSSSWHVMMCSSDAVVVYTANGQIDPTQSYVLVHEQDAVGTKTEKKDVTQENGVILRQLGTVDNKYTFKTLLSKNYIPFTLKEFVGEDPVEPGDAWLGTETNKLDKTGAMTVNEISQKTLWGNYAVVVMDFQVKNPEGRVLYSWAPDFATLPTTYSITLGGTFDTDLLAAYANGQNTIHIYARLANGELLEAYSGVLKID